MRVKELVDKIIGKASIKIWKSGEPVLDINSKYWPAISDSILDLAVKYISVDTKLMDSPCIRIMATEGETAEVSTFKDLQDALDDDLISDITLEADICGDDSNEHVIELTSGEKSLDLNGHRISVPDGTENENLYAIAAFGESTILNIYDSTGEGLVDGNDKAAFNCCIVQGEGATVNVYGGTYETGNQKDGGSTTIYAQDGTINLYDGVFKNLNWDNEKKAQGNNVVMNITNNSGSYINCYGGKYYGQNPEDGDDKDTATGKTFLASGCKVTADETGSQPIYTVTKEN